MKKIFLLSILPLWCSLPACQNPSADADQQTVAKDQNKDPEKDWHTQSEVTKVQFNHLILDVTVDFEERKIKGSAEWQFEHKDSTAQVVLDTRNLQIDSVLLDGNQTGTFSLAAEDPILGSALSIPINPETKSVKIYYQTGPQATALQWLEPSQTFGKKQPFLYTQSESIYARSWIPCPDGPGIRYTYEATVSVPKGLLALMSAENPQKKSADGVYKFTMNQPIPAYLMALAVGDIQFQAIDERTGVYAEPSLLPKALSEFEDIGDMVHIAEELYGPYRWGRYDVLVLPSGFPIGGMENPKLTFCTPTILAGDKSLVNLIAHELAHNWSGNLVTNATWNDFWLNEGFTMYFERRITEAMHNKDYVDMLWELGYQDLKKTVTDLGATSKDTWLKLDLKGRDPDIGLTDIAYEKGAAFLHLIERTVGRSKMDSFLRAYFESHAFTTISTDRFIQYLHDHLLKGNPEYQQKINIDKWVFAPGIPDDFPRVDPVRFAKVAQQSTAFLAGVPASELATKGWSTYEWMHFLRHLPQPMPVAEMAELDKAFHFSATGNSEIAAVWYLQSIHAGYEPAYPAMKEFLYVTGRQKFLEPLYEALMSTPEGKTMAQEIYKKARPNYHPLTHVGIDRMLKNEEQTSQP